MSELERLSEICDRQAAELQKVHIEQATQKVKSGVWGLMGGLITVVIALGLTIAGYLIKSGK